MNGTVTAREGLGEALCVFCFDELVADEDERHGWLAQRAAIRSWLDTLPRAEAAPLKNAGKGGRPRAVRDPEGLKRAYEATRKTWQSLPTPRPAFTLRYVRDTLSHNWNICIKDDSTLKNALEAEKLPLPKDIRRQAPT